MSSDKRRGAHIGSASVLLIFSVLSLISFATLTLVNAKADYNLSKNLSDRQSAYYDACHKGNAFVAAVDSGYSKAAANGIIEESIPITDNQSLDIAIIQSSINNSDFSFPYDSIIKWEVVNNGNIEYDTTLPVMK